LFPHIANIEQHIRAAGCFEKLMTSDLSDAAIIIL